MTTLIQKLAAHRTQVPLLVVMVGLVASGCRRSEQPPGAPAPTSSNARQPQATEPIEIEVAKVVRASVDRSIEVTGSMFAFEDTVISAKLSERIVSVAKDFGDVVKQGEPLAELDRTDFQLALDERRAQAAAALAKIGLSALPTGDIDLEQLPAVARARAESMNARAKLDRARRLFEQSPPLLSEQDFADIRTASEVASNQVDVEIMNARAALAEARAQAAAAQTAEQRLSDTLVRAPTIEGQPGVTFRVAERQASIGAFVREGAPLFRLVANDPVRYRAQIPDRFAGEVRVGQAARVYLSDDAQASAITGEVSRVWPVVDPASRSFIAEILLANPAGELKPGAFAKGEIVLRREENVQFVPESAVWSFAGLNRVFAIKDGKAVEHRVQLGVRRDGVVEIRSPLASDQVAAKGVTGLTSGAPVRIRDAAAAPGPKN